MVWIGTEHPSRDGNAFIKISEIVLGAGKTKMYKSVYDQIIAKLQDSVLSFEEIDDTDPGIR